MLFNLIYACGFLLGVSAESLGKIPLPLSSLLWAGLFCGALRKKLTFVVLFFLFGVLVTQRYEERLETQLQSGFQKVSGWVAEEVDRRSDVQNLSVQTLEGEVLARVSLYEEVEFGDEVELEGDVELRAEMLDEDASYRNYLARQGVVATMYDAKLVDQKTGPASFRRALYAFKAKVEGRLQALLPEPESSFAAGLLLGSRKGMPEHLTEAFRTVGLLHIVAISGANISLVIATVFALLSFIPLRLRIGVSVCVLAIFVLLVGATSTVIRAAVMGVLTLWGLYFGKRSTALFGLLWSVVLLVLWNPYLLLFDVGFQLSVLSTLGLLVFVPMLQEKLAFLNRLPVWADSFKEAFVLTIAAQLTTLPLMLHFFGQTSWVTPFVNVLVAPLIPLAMLASLLALFVPLFMTPAWVFLMLIEETALLSAELPGAALSLTISLKTMAVLYFLELIFLVRFYKSTLRRAFVRCPALRPYKVSNLEFERRETPAASLASIGEGV